MKSLHITAAIFTLLTLPPTCAEAQVFAGETSSPYAGLRVAVMDGLSEGVGQGVKGAAIIAAIGTGAAVNGTFLAAELIHGADQDSLSRGWAFGQLAVAGVDLITGVWLLYDGNETSTALGTGLFGLSTVLGTVSVLSLILDEPPPASVGLGIYENGGASLSVTGVF